VKLQEEAKQHQEEFDFKVKEKETEIEEKMNDLKTL